MVPGPGGPGMPGMRWTMRARRVIGMGVAAVALAVSCPAAAQSASPNARLARADADHVEVAFTVPMDTSVPPGPDAVRTVPARAITCDWLPEDEGLDCRLPVVALPRATRIRVQLGAGLRTADGRPFAPTELAFETAPPRLEVKVLGSSAGTPALVIESDLPLRAGTLEGKLVLRAGDRQWPVAVQARGTTPEGGTRLALAWPGDVPADVPLQLHVDGPFFAEAGDVPGSERRALATFRSGVPPRLASVDCVESGEDAPGRRVQPPPAGAAEALSLTCRETQVLRLRWTAVLDDASRARLLRALPAGARAWFRDGAWPLDDKALRVPGTELTVVGLRPGDALHWRAGDALTAVDARAVAMPALALTTVPEKAAVVLPSAALPPDARARVLPRTSDAPAFAMGWIGFDGGLRGGRIDVPDSRGTERAVTSPEVDALLARGGWVEWNAPLAAPMRSVAWAPPFDVRLAALRGAIAVWAVPWRGDGAIADAEVELHRISESEGASIVARGRTDAQGVVVLALPPGVQGGARVRWGVQVHHRDGTASQLLDTDAPLGGRARDDVGAWLVTDRLVYRPGDVVRFSGWRRVRVDGKGRTPGAEVTTLAFKVFSAERSIDVRVRWDAEGRAHGQLRLPRDLPTDDYCFEGLTWHAGCVSVERDPAHALWLGVARAEGVDALTFTLDAGTADGGAPDASLSRSGEAFIDGWSPARVYPAWAAYTFLPLERPDGARLPVEVVDMGDGRARVQVRSDLDGADPLPLSGNLLLELRAGTDQGHYAASTPPRTPWAPSAGTRYVGLALAPRDARAPTRLQADGVVIDAQGTAVPGARITLELRDADAIDAPVLARCALVGGVPGTCAWPAGPPRRWRVTARSGDAIPSEQIVELPAGSGPSEAVVTGEATWSWRAVPERPGAPARIAVHHGFAEADVLALAARADGQVVAQAARLRAGGELVLPSPGPDPTQRDTVWRLLVRERLPADADPQPARIQTMVVDVPQPASPTPSPLQVAFADGGRALQVRNTGDTPVDAVVSVLDEVSPLLVPWQWDDRNPARSPLRAAFDTHRYLRVAPLFSAPHGHTLSSDRGDRGAWSGATRRLLARAAAASFATVSQGAACAGLDAQAQAFWQEMNLAEPDDGLAYGGPHPWQPVTPTFVAPMPRDHAWPAGAPRGGDGHDRHRALLWEPAVTLAPGETRTFALPAASQPVHWVARAWTVVAPGVVTASDAHVAIAPTPQE